MVGVGRLWRNLSAQFLSQFVSRILSFLLIIALARELGVKGFGIYSTAFAFVMIFMSFADLGTRELIIREIARNHNATSHYLRKVTVLRTGSGIFIFVMLMGAGFALGYDSTTITTAGLIGFSKVIDNIGQIFSALLAGLERMGYSEGVQVVERLLTTGISLSLIYSGYGVIPVAGTFIVGSIGKLVMSIYLYRRVRNRLNLDRFNGDWIDIAFWFSLLRESWPFLIGSFLAVIVFDIDKVMISVMIGESETGLYNSAYRLMSATGIISGSFASAIYPTLSRLYTSDNNDETYGRMLDTGVKYMLAISIPLGAGTVITADEILITLFGSSYYKSILVLQILIWAQVGIFLSRVLTTVVKTINKQHYNALNAGIAAVVNIILNFLLIPAFGINGAALATVLTGVCVLVLELYWVHRFYRLPNFSKLPNVLTSTAIMGIIVWRLDYLNMPIYILVLVGVISYTICIYYLNVIDEQDIRIIRESLG